MNDCLTTKGWVDFLFGKNLEEDIGFLTAAVESGEVTAARIDEAVTRILALKASLGLHKKQAIQETTMLRSSAAKRTSTSRRNAPVRRSRS